MNPQGDSTGRPSIRFQNDERPPLAITAGLGFQFAILCIAGIVLTPAIVIRAGGGSEDFLNWAVFAAVLVSSITTTLQAVRLGRIGSGYILLMGTSAAFISVCVGALQMAGPAMLCTLVVISALFQFALAGRLQLFRHILTPAVAGTVIMLIPVTVMPVIFDMLTDVPEGASVNAAAMSALVTIVVIVLIGLRARGAFRLWSPVIGVVAGTIVGAFYGIYDIGQITDAAWIGMPTSGWPGFDLSFSATFWSLLPAFIFVTLVGAIETIGDAVAIQRVSWRDARAVDYRAVQGALAADGMGNLLSGLTGTVPNTTYSTSISVTELTGVGSRVVGIAIGASFLLMAFLPKVLALVVAIPGPVAAAYITVLLAMLFVVGMRIVVKAGVDYRKALIVGIAFWVGVGLQSGSVFPEFFSTFAGGLLQNGMTAGGLVAIVLSLFVELTQSRRVRIEIPLDGNSLPQVTSFIEKFHRRSGWQESMLSRLTSAAEEAIDSLMERSTPDGEADRRLQISAQKKDGRAELEFVAGSGDENLQDKIAILEEPATQADVEQGMSLRLLNYYASSVRHQQYHDVDILTIHVDP